VSRTEPLRWEYEGDGEWTAFSSVHDDGNPFAWWITITKDGRFSTAESAPELGAPDSFETLKAAKLWVEHQESEWLQTMAAEAREGAGA